VARLIAKQAEGDVRVTRLEAAAGAAEAFLALVAAQQAHRAAQANLTRWEVFASTVKTLADKELRPGAEASRAEAEVAGARIQLLQIEQLVRGSRATLAEAISSFEPPAEIAPGPLLARQTAAIETARARQDALDQAYYPRVHLLLSLNARGSGFGPAGDPLDANDGLWPDRAN